MAAKKTSTVAKANGAMAGSGKRTYVERRKNSVSDVRAMANARVVSVTGSLSALKSNCGGLNGPIALVTSVRAMGLGPTLEDLRLRQPPNR